MKIITTTRTSIKKITNLETTSTTPMTNRRWRRAMATVQKDRADPTTKIRTVSSERKIPDLLHLPTRVRRRAPTYRTLTKFFVLLDRCWKFRPPPRGFTSESYVLCQSFIESSICNYGSNCVEAHDEEELREWKERFEIRKNKLENSLKTQYGKSYTEDLLERLHQSTNPEKIMKERLDGVDVTCSNELNLTVSSKTCKREWIFVLKTTKLLKAVALLQDEHRTHFSIKHVYPMLPGKQATNQIDGSKVLNTDQEWLAIVESGKTELESVDNETLVSHRVKICFSTDIYGEIQ